MELAKIIGIIGTILAFIEIWKPKISIVIENYIGMTMENFKNYRKDMGALVNECAEEARYFNSELMKGFQPKSPQENYAAFLELISNVKKASLTYTALFIYFFILSPVKKLINNLNHLGKGRVVGGIGIALNVVGLCL